MALPLTCPRGHQWDAGELPTERAQKCPVCGLAPVRNSANFPATLDFQPAPNCAEPPWDDTQSTLATIPRSPDPKEERQPTLSTHHIPGYEILGELGRGGMGVVYKARQLKLNRIVALKMILSGASADPQQLDRFRAEAAAVALLHHPYIVQIFEINEHDGCPFFSLEYVDGGTLAQKLNRAAATAAAGRPNRSPPRPGHAQRASEGRHSSRSQARQYPIGDGDGGTSPARIIFWPRCRRRSGSMASPRSPISVWPSTSTFSRRHEPARSSVRPATWRPNRPRGAAHAIGPATDVYGLGAIFYEMLTGRPPFESESSLTTIRRLLGEDPLPPTQMHLKVPRDLETICLKCLEKDPARRYPSAEALAEDLQRYLSNQPIEARPIGWWGRSVKWVRRHPSKATVAGVLILAALTLLTFGGMYHLRLERAFAETRQYAEDSHRNLVRLQVTQGTSAMNAGDGFTALLWFTEALRLDAAAPEHEETHRQRIAALEQGLPRPKQLWVHEGASTIRALAPMANKCVTASDDGMVYLWDSETGQPAAAPLKAGGPVVQAIFSRDGRRVAAISRDGTAHVWDVADGKPKTKPLPLVGKPLWIDFSPDGQQVVTASGESARVWDVATGQLLPGELHHNGLVNVALFSPDGRWLATAGDDGLVRLWNPADRKSASIVLVHVARCFVSPSARRKRIASGSTDNTAQVWNVADGSPVARHIQLRDHVVSLAFSPFGQRLLTSSENGASVIWRVADSEPLVEPMRHTSPVHWSIFSPDGCRVATASDDNTARISDPRPRTADAASWRKRRY